VSTDLQTIKQELDKLRTALSAAKLRRDEVMAGLSVNYGYKSAAAAAKEQKKLREQTIPTLTKKRDGFISKAEEVLNGLNTGAGPGAGTGAQAGPAGAGQPGGLQKGRTLLGRRG